MYNEGREEIRAAAKYRAYNIFETLSAAVTKKKEKNR